MGLRTASGQALPEILGVALDEFTRHGYDATSVRAIAKRLNVSVPALYYHYENKQAILTSLLTHAMNVLEAIVNQAIAEAVDEPRPRLAALVKAVILYITHHRDLAFLDREMRSLTPENRSHYAKRRDYIERLVTECIDRGCSDGSFATPLPRESSRAILSMCLSVPNWYRPDGTLTPEDLARRYVTLALDMVRSVANEPYVHPSTLTLAGD